MDYGFEILPNTADIRIKIWGRTLQELFCNALRGMAAFVEPGTLDAARTALKEKWDIKVEALDLTSLFVKFLSEVIARSDTENTVYLGARFKKFGENFLEGKLLGIKVEDGFEKEIKAVSYQEVDIKKNSETGLYETVLVFDI
ncbi:MAG: hypothetical protein A3C07_03925 [Candidatus Sungbacteria bacterium RIFCSPHIGHO2_02_FULL_47_11]|uniref:Archease domain-containing protein n=1 Tax=Candidatus Sungbacteria bacterium RIFCSPHIGHO2_02_FULL_47_11 TaxID=1802270 RepID=A0A1G2KJL0_9BACT|nr:MAG: hypothetical protein A3C07_03925 [Candidatus Sungbacteria bacterium RIFCSPHIGHO2_02_FULL_47_11]